MDYTVAQTHKRKASVDAGTGPAPKRHALATELTRTPVDATASHPLQRTKIDLVGFMKCSELRDLVTYSLNARDFLSLRNTCKEFRGLAQNINTRLRRFVSRPVEFRSLQAETEALLTGGFALSFIEGQTENMSDLKVYVHHGHANKWIEYLEQEHYKVRLRDSSVLVSEMCAVRRTLQPRTLYSSTIDLYAVRGLPLAYIMGTMNISALGNIITWNKAYVLFPTSIFSRRKSMYRFSRAYTQIAKDLCNLNRLGWPTERMLVEQVEAPGFDERRPWDEWDRWGPEPTPTCRRIGDTYSCRTPLQTDRVSPGPPAYRIELCEFHVILDRAAGDGVYNIRQKVFHHPLLQRTYLTSWVSRHEKTNDTNDLVDTSMFHILRSSWLDQLLPWEAMQHPKARWQGPLGLGGPVRFDKNEEILDVDLYPNTFHRQYVLEEAPPSWTFLDDQMAKRYIEEEQKVRQIEAEEPFNLPGADMEDPVERIQKWNVQQVAEGEPREDWDRDFYLPAEEI